MDSETQPRHSYNVPPTAAVLSIVALWTFYFVSVTVRSALLDYDAHLAMIDNRAGVTLAGMGFCWLLYLYLRTLDGKSLGVRITAALLASIPVAAAYAAMNYWSFYVFDPIPVTPAAGERVREAKSAVRMIAESSIQWYILIAFWSALYLALSYAGEVRTAEREAARLRAAAQASELRALRYQVNPHFLFNTLNSLSSLVMSGKRAAAETMILNLATFFRTSLSADPTDDVPLSDEIALQTLYLEIEMARFPDRLQARFTVEDGAGDACVPGLILQPIVENAIKYGVAPARRPIVVALTARRVGDQLEVVIENDGDSAAVAASGTGVGLRNVRDRLFARFGDAATLETSPGAEGGYRARLTMPWTADAG